MEFKWTFNNSAESIDVANNHVTRTGKVYDTRTKQKTVFSLPIYTGDDMMTMETVLDRGILCLSCLRNDRPLFGRKICMSCKHGK